MLWLLWRLNYSENIMDEMNNPSTPENEEQKEDTADKPAEGESAE
jgi:hypothetical protein